jgi:hypothetical protein
MNRFLEFISHGPHQIQRTFFSDLEHEAGPVPETLVAHLYPKTVHSQKSTEAFERGLMSLLQRPFSKSLRRRYNWLNVFNRITT